MELAIRFQLAKTKRRKEKMAKAILSLGDLKPNSNFQETKSQKDGFGLTSREVLRYMNNNYDENIALTAPFRAYAADHGWAAASLAIAWLLAQGDHILPIPGTRSVAHLTELAAARDIILTDQMLADIEQILPVGWAYGDRYSQAQWIGPERYC